MTEPTPSSIDLHPDATEIDHDVMPGSPEWLTYMTGSKVSAVLGISPFTTRLELWRQMTGRAEPQPVSAHMQWGTDREPIIREATAAELGCVIHNPRMLVSKHNPRHAYSPDGIAAPDALESTLWECKTATEKSAAAWANGIPEHYTVQWQWGSYVTGYEYGLFTLETHTDFVPISTADYPIMRDDELIEQLIDAVDEFLGYVDSDTPPPPLGAVVVEDSNDRRVVERWVRRNKLRLKIEKAISEDCPVVDKLGENALALMTADGDVLCHWIESHRSADIVDWAAIEAEQPEAVKQAVVTSVDRKRLAELVPDAVKVHTTTTTSTTRSLRQGARK